MPIGLSELVVLLIIGFSYVFWAWMLIDCATKETDEENQRLVWVIIIAVAHVIGALLYLFVRRPKRVKTLGK